MEVMKNLRKFARNIKQNKKVINNLDEFSRNMEKILKSWIIVKMRTVPEKLFYCLQFQTSLWIFLVPFSSFRVNFKYIWLKSTTFVCPPVHLLQMVWTCVQVNGDQQENLRIHVCTYHFSILLLDDLPMHIGW